MALPLLRAAPQRQRAVLLRSCKLPPAALASAPRAGLARRAPQHDQRRPGGATSSEASAPPPPPPPPRRPPPSQGKDGKGTSSAKDSSHWYRRFGKDVFVVLPLSLGVAVSIYCTTWLRDEAGIGLDSDLVADSRHAAAHLKEIRARAKKLDLVRQLSADPEWETWEAYEGLRGPDKGAGTAAAAAAAATDARQGLQDRLTSGAIDGPWGLEYQRVFHHRATGECVTVAFLGPRLCGWPGVVHGGALATLLDESLGRAAILRFPARTGVTANLELKYRAPTRANQFVVVRARPLVEGEAGAGSSSSNDRKMWVRGSIEKPDGSVLVDAKALFVVPKGVKLSPLAERW